MYYRFYVIFVCVLYLLKNVTFAAKNQSKEEVKVNDAKVFETLKTNRKAVQDKIVSIHNYFRRRVSPPAANMLQMTWNKNAASIAQKYADTCGYLVHSNSSMRVVEPYGACGENIHIVFPYAVSWYTAIKDWWMERKHFTYGNTDNDLKLTGHYSQLVWSTTHQVGCGIARCKNGNGKNIPVFYNYICHYCPAGNIIGIQHYPYKQGKPCDSCFAFCTNSLCTNTCHHMDKYNNCEEYVNSAGGRACDDCKATCSCGKTNKLFKNYPYT